MPDTTTTKQLSPIAESIKTYATAMQHIHSKTVGHAQAIMGIKERLRIRAEAAFAQKEISFSKEELQGLTDKQVHEAHAEALEKMLEESQAKPVTRSSGSETPTWTSSIQQNPNEWEIDGEEPLPSDMALAPIAESVIANLDSTPLPHAEGKYIAVESFSLNIVLNEKQMAARDLAFAGKSFCLIGPAGSGKTTAQRAIARALLDQKALSLSRFKSYDSMGKRIYISAPSFAAVAYTIRAASNLAKAIFKDPELEKQLAGNIMTVHALLEYEPETYWDALEGKERFRFAPKRTAANPLDITHLVIEESSMLGALDLWPKLFDALPYGVQIIFIGDINQLPPVFGPSILNYALMQLPIIELTEVYRNQGIVLENAHHILKGEDIVENADYQIARGKNPVQYAQHKTAMGLAGWFSALSNTMGSDGCMEYDPEDCIILSPFNKHECGTDFMNKIIAQFVLGPKNKPIVYEIIAGFSKQYLAVGDKVMFNKRDAVITEIRANLNYHGKTPQIPGSDLTRFGARIIGAHQMGEFEEDMGYSNFSLESLDETDAGRKQQASHIVHIEYDGGGTEEISSAGDFSPQVFSLGYCLTVHKAQGSEWRKVFILFHKDHAVMLYRELFYTAATRARTKVVIIAKDPSVRKALKNQRIKGNKLKEKLEFFNSGIDQITDIQCTKV